MEGGNLGIGPIGKFTPAGWGMAAKPCDTCKSAAALLFCRVDSVFLCIGCDAKVHQGLGHMQAHARVWMCEVCEHAPASVTCKADAAALCVSCDRDIHSANPLSSRHERIPVVPFYDTAEAVVKSAAAGDPILVPAGDETTEITNNCSHTCFSADDETTVTPASWLFPIPHAKLAGESPDVKSVEFLFSDSDQFLDFDYPVTDSVVPVQPMKSFEATAQQMMNQSSNKCLEIDFTSSKLNLFNNNHCYTAQSFSQSISSSSMDVGVVPDGSSMSEISYGRTCSGTVDPTGSINTTPSQGSDREARVLRYREKRKNRKFEKTIRYASRKAYAETRPRIKGRFAKRSETEPEIMNRMFNSGSSVFMSDAAGYGVVPSF